MGDIWTPPRVGVCAASLDGELQLRARAVATETNLTVVPRNCEDHDLLLVVSDRGLELRETGPGAAGAVRVDFGETGADARRLATASRRQPLARAVGLKKRTPTVLDATAGLGRDAIVLARLGCVVTAVERSPVLAAMLRDALDRAAAQYECDDEGEPHMAPASNRCPVQPASHRCPTSVAPVSNRCSPGRSEPETLARVTAGRPFNLIIGDATTILSGLSVSQAPDVVYLDPMFPPSGKSALPKKEMRILRRLVGDDPDAAALLNIARRTARDRVVVKRTPRDPALGPEPTMSYRSKLARYDVYLTREHGQ